VKDDAALGVACEDAIEHQGVIVDVEVQASEALHAEHRAALSAFDAVLLGAVRRERRLHEDAREGGEPVGFEDRQPELEGRKDVLANGDIREHAVDELRGAVGIRRPVQLGQTVRP
jgi:hypothetical protein